MAEALAIRIPPPEAAAEPPVIDPAPFVARSGDGTASILLLVDGIHCAACVERIERALERTPGVLAARVNMTTNRLAVRWAEGSTDAAAIVGTLARLGYGAVPFNADQLADGEDHEGRRLLRSLAVAGFSAANVMLLSIAVWAGAFSDMGGATRGLFHWVSALIVLPAVAYAVQPFLTSAVAGLRRGEMRMDLPISVGVLLTAGMSLFESVRGGPHVYFDAAISLLFFLLIGRYLDRRARARACSVAENLLVLRGATAMVIEPDGRQRALQVGMLRDGMTVLVAAGGRVPADGVVAAGHSDLDTSLVTGETVPQPVAPGDRVYAGTLNQTAPITLSVTAAGERTLLAEIVRLMEAAAQGRARYVRVADRAARVYSPVVHLAALATFALWYGALAAPWQQALLTAVAVLIITCPCALGLAVPVVQVVASGRLLKAGILLKAADGLERLAAVDTVVFDKTGTLSLGRLRLENRAAIAPEDLALAASLGAASRHPLCQAVARAAGGAIPHLGVEERPGEGLSTRLPEGEVRLGRRGWCGVPAHAVTDDADGPELWLAAPGRPPVRFLFHDELRSDAAEVVAWLRRRGLRLELLSGDRAPVVAAVAQAVGIDAWRAGCRPADKIARLKALAAEGRTVLMVGDGLNDAPALAAAHVSMSPASAADVSQAAADVVFQGDRLGAVREACEVARRSQRLVLLNFALAIAYNVIAVPFAVAGLVTPLIAAIAMSASSLVVTLNALRLYVARRRS